MALVQRYPISLSVRMCDEALPTVDAVAASVAIQFLEAKILLHRARNFFFPLDVFASYLFHIWLIISVTPRLVPRIAPPKTGEEKADTGVQ